MENWLRVLMIGLLLSHKALSRPRTHLQDSRGAEKRRIQMLDKRQGGGTGWHNQDNVTFDSTKSFQLPPTLFWGGFEWMIYEMDGNGHGYDIIDNLTISIDSIAMELIGSFEVYINGKMQKPFIDRSNMPVQIAQNNDHHYFTMQQHAQKRRIKRNFASVRLWDDGIIPYEIDIDSIGTSERIEKIREGIKEMNDLTCLQISPRNEVSSPPHTTFLRFINNNQGCWSYVGRVSNSKQEIGLDNYCYDKSTVIHEIMHAIGMHHEQQRSDRDTYIEMLWSNIQGGQSNNNMRQEVTDDKNAYDAESLLQYGLRAFAIDSSKPSMRLKDKNLEFLPNSAKGLTFYDVKDITTGYDCTRNCNPMPTCANEGFVGWTCQCMCPMGLKGATCNELDTDSGPCTSDCGAIVNLASGSSQIIESPNYANGNHPLDKECVWLIRGPPNSKIEVHIENMDLRNTANGDRCFHWLEVRYNLLGQTGPKRCGVISGETWTTTDINGRSNLMLLKFDSRFSKDVAGNRGFRLNVTAVGGDPTPPDDCNPNPCQNNGICSLTATSYTCQCTGGFTGTTCEVAPPQACDSSPCQNNGVCLNTGTTFSCQCTTAWSGPTCEISVQNSTRSCNFEPSTTCFLLNNYATTLATSQTNPSTAASGSYFVAPAPTGNYITLMIDNGELNLQNGQAYCFEFKYAITRSDVQIAIYAEDDTSYTNPLRVWSGVNDWASATFDFTASTGSNPMLDIWYPSNTGYGAVDDVTIRTGQCSTPVQPCDSNPCQNGGTCSNSGDTYTCTCPSGWQGASCEQQVLSCTSSTCSNGGTCSENGGSITCSCAPGWTGTTCADQIQPCDSSPCLNGGSCTNSGNSFTCDCTQGFTGVTCTDQIQPCDSSPCLNGGSCTNSGNSFTCDCTQGWTGVTCTDQIQPCDSSPCLNGGSCTNSGNSFTCDCTQGWTGVTCTDAAASSSFRCTFEPSTPCFLLNNYTPIQATSQTSPSQAFEGSYFVAPSGSQGWYITLKINSTVVNFIEGQIYCLEFYFTILSDNVEVGIYDEMDTNYFYPIQIWRNRVNWSQVRYTFTSLPGRNPMLDIYYVTGAGSAAIDNVSIQQGSC